MVAAWQQCTQASQQQQHQQQQPPPPLQQQQHPAAVPAASHHLQELLGALPHMATSEPLAMQQGLGPAMGVLGFSTNQALGNGEPMHRALGQLHLAATVAGHCEHRYMCTLPDRNGACGLG